LKIFAGGHARCGVAGELARRWIGKEALDTDECREQGHPASKLAGYTNFSA